ncbi:MAG: hypothetical protein ACT4PE_02955 [Candidatus Eiseniibacteriota bacterium]
MTALLVALLLGGRPAERAELVLEDGVPWGGTSLEYLASPLPGDLLHARGVGGIQVEYRTETAGIDVVLVGTDRAYRRTLAVAPEGAKVTIPFDEFGAPSDFRARFLRFESPDPAVDEAEAIEVRRVAFLETREQAPETPAPAAALPSPVPTRDGVFVSGGRLFADREPHFPFGLFLLAGNRSLMERLGHAGANAVAEYTASWPYVTLEDHLDYAHCAGVRVAAGLTWERPGRIEPADGRLLLLHGHPQLLAWYLFDEPDGGVARGLPAADCAPEALAERRSWLGETPVFVTCLDSFGLSRYAAAGSMLATDLYWPASGKDRSAASIFSEAEAVVEVAARVGALPVMVLQLADPVWAAAGRVTTPEVMRAQALASLAAGIRGIFYFQGVTALRLAQEGHADGRLWNAFLALSSEMATLGPLAARWTRVPGEPELDPAVGEVRAGCFEESGERWIVLVNLGGRPAEVRLGGSCLDGAEALVDPRDGWRGEVRSGAWSGRLESFDGRVVRVVRRDAAPRRRPAVEAVLQQPPGPRARRILYYDRAILGATLYPAPEGAITIALDGVDRTADAVVHRGAAAVVRLAARDLAPGPHRVVLSWDGGGRAKQQSWTLQVVRVPLPFEDSFEREELGDGWGAAEDVPWNQFDPDALPAAGSIGIENGAMVVRSTAGPIGAVLRKFEAPAAFTLKFRVHVDEPSEILIQRNELFCPVTVRAGRRDVVFRETPQEQTAFVDGEPAGRWTPSLDHRGGVVAVGVAAGAEASFDDFRIEAP